MIRKIFNLFIFLFSISLLIFSKKEVFAGPKIIIQSAPQQIYKNEEFSTTFTVTIDSLSSDSYYIKGRIGSTSATLNQGETYSPILNSWLSDNASWSNFPIFNFLNSSIATVSVNLRTKSTSVSGNNLLVIRLNRNSVSYDSSSSALLILDPLPTSTPVPSLGPTETPIPTPTTEQSTNETISITPTPISYNNIFISEAMVNPQSGEHEWIELFNNNEFSVFLINWFIDDIENAGSSPKIFSLDLPAKSYGVFELTSSMFNNSGDSVRLLDFNKNIKDSFEYTSSTQEKTYGRIAFDSDDFCLQEPSKNQLNNSCINPTPTPYPTPTKIPTPSKTPTVTPSSTKMPINSSTTAIINRSTSQPQNIFANQLNNFSGNNEEVLGASTEIKQLSNKPLINSLSFASFSYSLLAMISIVLKISSFKTPVG